MSPLALSQACQTRWLSYENAVSKVRKVYEALLVSLNREGYENECPKARGYLEKLKRWRTVVIIEFLSLILPRLSGLSKTFQVTT